MTRLIRDEFGGWRSRALAAGCAARLCARKDRGLHVDDISCQERMHVTNGHPTTPSGLIVATQYRLSCSLSCRE